MRTAETILTVMRNRGQRGLQVNGTYRLLYNRDLYLCAYGKLYRNKGAMTEGVTSETVDGMTLEKIDNIIKLLKNEKYRWTPVRRTYIPKKNKKLRALSLPTWSDKLLQEVIRLIMEAYYDPQFSDCSHGFRPKRGCHTALKKVVNNGGISLKWNKNSYINDEIVKPILFNRSELIQRLVAQECELCGSTKNIEVHHIHKLTDLKKKGQVVLPEWKRWMLTKTRKTLVVCKECHRQIHDGKYDGRKLVT